MWTGSVGLLSFKFFIFGLVCCFMFVINLWVLWVIRAMPMATKYTHTCTHAHHPYKGFTEVCTAHSIMAGQNLWADMGREEIVSGQ